MYRPWIAASLAALLALAFAGCKSPSECKGDSVVCADSCSDLDSDNLNCGRCGAACGAGQVCSQGACALTCAPGLVRCGGGCIDPTTDRLHCGASAACTGMTAGAACEEGEVCSGGSCQLSCQAGLVDCNGLCTEPLTSRVHCGASGPCTGAQAGATCAAGEVCSAGTCRVSCQAGLVQCYMRCIDPATDRAFCGASGTCTGASAGTTCGAEQACHLGRCRDLVPVPVCTWQLVASSPLAMLPGGAEIMHAGDGGASFTTAFGRSAFLVTSDWGLLRIPTGLSGEASFAVEVDVYASSSVWFPSPGLTVFTDWGPAPVWRTHGVAALLFAPPGEPRVAGTMVYVAGDPCNGWGSVDCSPTSSGILRKTAALGPFEDGWRTLRIEGNRAACRFRSYLDGAPLDTFAGACDVTGGGAVLEGHRSAAFSNFKLFSGTADCSP